MAKFVAKQPISNAFLAGLNILTSPSGVTFTQREPDGFVADNDTIRLKVSGEDFGYFGGRPKATGTITGIKYYNLDVYSYKLSDAKIALRDVATSTDIVKLTEKAFAKNDKIVGSEGNDQLYGFKGKDKLNGKAGDDVLYGGGGKDVLDGGDGTDILDGGPGTDTFVFKSDPSLATDYVVSFEVGERIELSAKVFSALAHGPLAEHQFVIGSASLDADDRIIYHAASGSLFYDADGTGATAAVKIAVLPVNLDHIGAGNIFVV